MDKQLKSAAIDSDTGGLKALTFSEYMDNLFEEFEALKQKIDSEEIWSKEDILYMLRQFEEFAGWR